jgi:hypothetical protein
MTATFPSHADARARYVYSRLKILKAAASIDPISPGFPHLRFLPG